MGHQCVSCCSERERQQGMTSLNLNALADVHISQMSYECLYSITVAVESPCFKFLLLEEKYLDTKSYAVCLKEKVMTQNAPLAPLIIFVPFY